MTESPGKILLVEDEGLLAAHLIEELAHLGYAAEAVNSGEKALSTIAAERPDLVLMDIKLKGPLDGIQTSLHIKDRFGIPVIYLTAHADPDTIARACPSQPFGYLVKPIDGRELAATVQAALYRCRAEQQLRMMAEEQRQMEAGLRETQRLESLGVVAAGVAHDFNNLLAIIVGHSTVLEAVLAEDHPGRESLRKILTASRRGAELCRQMMLYAGTGLRVNSLFSLAALAEETADLLRATFPPKARLEMSFPTVLPLVRGDPGQIRQVIINLVINASESLSTQSGFIRLSAGTKILTPEALSAAAVTEPTCLPGEFVFLEVSDTGCGMDRETLRRIFDPFFSTKFLGRGLGLAAVSGIVRAHKSALTVQSQPGRGTTFCLFLPVATGELALSS